MTPDQSSLISRLDRATDLLIAERDALRAEVKRMTEHVATAHTAIKHNNVAAHDQRQLFRKANAELRTENSVLRAEVKRLSKAHDRLIDRSVGAMAIAKGADGYEKVPIDCPMLEAVSALRADKGMVQTSLNATARNAVALRAEVAALRKDAERWQIEALAWRNGCDSTGAFGRPCVNVAALADKPRFTDGRGNSLDHLVDEKP